MTVGKGHRRREVFPTLSNLRDMICSLLVCAIVCYCEHAGKTQCTQLYVDLNSLKK